MLLGCRRLLPAGRRTFSAAAATSGNWSFPVPVRFGPGRISEVPAVLSERGCSRPLLVTDRGLASIPAVTDLLASLRAAGMHPLLFSDVSPNPTDVNVADGAAAFRSHGADAVIALGGGSGLDAGKSIAMLSRAGGGVTLRDFEWTRPQPVDLGPPGTCPPVVCVPTTAGTGAEMDAASMCTDTERREKYCVTHPDCRIAVVADPLLTTSLPPHLTAWTGMDALTHALEAYFVDAYHPLCDGIALEALRTLQLWLPAAVRDGGDVPARCHMLAASSLAAVAFQKGLGSVHGLSEPVGAVHDTQHGLTNAVLLPHVLRANRPAIEAKCEVIAQCLALPCPPASYAAGGSGGFLRLAYWVDSLCSELGIPRSLLEAGVPDDAAAAELGAKAAANPTGHTNPVETTARQYEAIFRAACAGREDYGKF